MGDRTWAQFTLYDAGHRGPNPLLELEEIFKTLEDMGLSSDEFNTSLMGEPLTEIVLYGDYTDSETSVGACSDAAHHLAEVAPNTAWEFHQDAYGNEASTDIYYFPGLGLRELSSTEEGIVWTSDEVLKIVAMHPMQRAEYMGDAWLKAAEGFRAWLPQVPEEQRTLKRPTPGLEEDLRIIRKHNDDEG